MHDRMGPSSGIVNLTRELLEDVLEMDLTWKSTIALACLESLRNLAIDIQWMKVQTNISVVCERDQFKKTLVLPSTSHGQYTRSP